MSLLLTNPHDGSEFEVKSADEIDKLFPNGWFNFFQAKAYTKVQVEPKGGWRFPTLEEAVIIHSELVQKNLHTFENDFYWTSDTHGPAEAYFISFSTWRKKTMGQKWFKAIETRQNYQTRHKGSNSKRTPEKIRWLFKPIFSSNRSGILFSDLKRFR